MKKLQLISCLIFTLITTQNLHAQTTVTLDSTVLTQREVTTQVQIPWEILWGPDDYIWATERRGQVLRINPTTGNTDVILNIQSTVEGGTGGEPGMLGMALHPDFANTPKVYLAYNYVSGFNIRERLVSYDWDGTSLSNQIILINDIPGGNIHNGARLLISTDGKILMTTGDTGSSNLSQDQSSLSGKLLRINLDGSIPTDNPTLGSYIYSYGHRNAQGLAYGPNGQLYSSEHGAQASDEFNRIVAGGNYGWPNVQGECNTSTESNYCNAFAVEEPLAEWSPCIAVNDIEYYNHPAIPEWENSFLMAVLGGLSGGAERISVLHLNADGSAITSEDQYFTNFGRLRDVCINPETGCIYIATNGSQYPGTTPNCILEYCNLAYAAAPHCTDGVQNEDETGVDCGGSCPACPTCDDGVQNGSELGVDCGGADCPACPDEGCDIYNFESSVVSYAANDQDFGTATVQDNGATVFMEGNVWKAIEINYTITPNTVIAFDFKSTAQGEIHEVAFDNDLVFAPENRIVVYGDQGYFGDFSNPLYSGSGNFERFTIQVGTGLTGTYQYLVLTGDDDASAAANSYFSNIQIYEDYNSNLVCDAACPAVLSLTTPVATGVYAAGIEVNCNTSLEGTANVSFQAGGFIWLDNGFQVPMDTDFEAIIQGCQ